MTLFPKTISYQYNAPGSYDGSGVFTPGSLTSSTFQGGVQPVTAEDIQNLPVGQQDTGVVKIYSDIQLPISKEGTNQTSAIVFWEGSLYEVIQKLEYQNDIIPHYKYVGAYRGEGTP